MTQSGEISSWWESGRNHFSDGEECVLEDQACDESLGLAVLGHEVDRDGPSDRLSIDDNLRILQLLVRADVVQSGLCVDCEPFLVWHPCGVSVTAIFEHQDVTTQ